DHRAVPRRPARTARHDGHRSRGRPGARDMNLLLQHLVVLPIIIPLMAGAAMLFLSEASRGARTTLALASVLAQLAIGGVLLHLTSDAAAYIWQEGVGVYAIGNWPA